MIAVAGWTKLVYLGSKSQMLVMLSAAARHTNLAQELRNLASMLAKRLLSKLQPDPAQGSVEKNCTYVVFEVCVSHQRRCIQYLHSTVYDAQYYCNTYYT